MHRRRRHTSKAVTVLSGIAKGKSYEQIIAANKKLTYLDIFNAAQLALGLVEKWEDEQRESNPPSVTLATPYGVNELKRLRYPRMGEPWYGEEERQLREMFEAGENIHTIAVKLERTHGGITQRLVRLGLMQPLLFHPARTFDFPEEEIE